MATKPISDRVIGGFRWLAVARFAGQIVTWVVTIFVIRILSPEDYGLMAMATVFIGFLAQAELGMSASIVQQEKLEQSQVAQIFGFVLLTYAGFFLLLLITADLIAQFFEEPRLVAIVRVLSLQFPLLALSAIPDAILRRRMEFRGKAVVNFVAMLVGGFTTLGLALVNFGVWALVYGNIAAALTRTIGFNLVAAYFCWPSFDFTGLRKVVVFGGQVTLERVLWFIYSSADIFLIGRILGKELLGFYSVAIHLAALPFTKLGALLNEISFSGFSRIQGNPREVSDQLRKATSAICFFAFPVFFGISAVAPEIISTLLGENWIPSAVPLQLLSLIIPLRMLDLVFPTALMATGRARISVGNAAFAAAILPTSFLIGLNWGLLGVCYAWLVGFTIYFCIAMFRSLPALGVSLTEYFSIIVPILASATTMVLVVNGVRKILPADLASSILSLVILSMSGAVTFLILALVFHRENLDFFLRRVIRR